MVGIVSSGFEATPTTAKCDPMTHEWNTNIPLVYGINIIRVIAWDKKHNPTEKTISVYCDPTDFRFVQITDVHIGWGPELLLDPESKEAAVKESVGKFADTLDAINGLNPKPGLLLITGDLVEWNDESFFEAFKSTLYSYVQREKTSGFDVQVHFIPGNHDRRKLNPLDDDNLVNYHKYIRASDNYCFSQGGYSFIGLDSGKDYNVSAYWGVPFDPLTLTYDHTPESYGLSQGQIEFLQQEPKNTPKIIFMHHPAIEEIGNKDVKSVESVSEDPVPPNGPGGNDGCIAFKRPEFIEYCKEYNVQLVLTGHTHVDKFLDADGNPVRVYTNGYYGAVKPLFVQTRNVTKDTQGYLVVDARDDAMRLFSPSGGYVPPSRYLCSITGPVNIHAYDSQDRHTGYGSVDVNIPESFYTGNYNGTAPDMPQMILLYNTTEEYRFEIVANLTEEEMQSLEIESFNFTVEQQTDDTRTTIFYLSVPLTENTTATLPINLTTTAYTMEIDRDGDGATDEIEDPDFTETNYVPTAAIIAPETGSIYNAGEPIEFNGTGRDPEDGILTNFSLVWYSDINGAIGAGERFDTTNLSAGAHRITLMVNDSTGLMSTQSIALTITNDWTPGDLNGDDTLTPADAAIALQLAATGAHDPAADVSGDDCVTSLDALMILQAAAGRIEL
jgi:3',5'-cyclic AMP phosphodiesterase CpdA